MSESIGGKLLQFRFAQSQPERLDKFLVGCLPDYSRSRIQAWIKDGRVSVDGQIRLKTGTMLDSPAQISVAIPPTAPGSLIPEPIPLDIVYENQDLLLVNKPAGMVVHPAAGHSRGSLVHAVLAHAPEIEGVGGVKRPGVVHRLDKGTSGLILLAKNDFAHRNLQDQFRRREVAKTYLALVDGAPPTPEGRVEAAVARDRSHRQRMAVVPPVRGRAAVSEYRTRERFPQHTLLEVRPITGRTHQIRLHAAFIGCPIVGDRVYGIKKITLPVKRVFLHAYQLEFRLPGEEKMRIFNAPLPAELEQILDSLRQGRIG